MPRRRACLFAVSLLAVPWTMHAPVHAERDSPRACIPITTPAELDNVRASMAGEYCLQNDIDMAPFGPFDPIGKVIKPFTGTFDGTGHVVRNLTVTAERQDIGLFGAISGGAVSNLTLAGVTITSARKTKSAGGIVGLLFGGSQVNNVRVTGRIECTSRLCRQGGIAGETLPGTAITDSSSAAFVAGGSGGAAGQIAGAIARTYATGSVSCRNNCAAGGLVGWMTDGEATDAFATGPVAARNESTLGGFAGYMGAALRAYSTGMVKVKHDSAAAAFAGYFAGATTETFGTGRVNGRSDSLLGGFAAQLGENEPADSSYWDRQITRQTFSVRGAEQTTAGLQADLPAGFGSGWGISKGFSYPYLDLLDSGMFASTLATTLVNKRLYTFVPLSQREPTEYAGTPLHTDAASLAAVFTMVARAVGLTDDVAELEAVKIDQDFWKDAAQTATWAGPVTAHASIGAGITIAGATPIDDTNIIGALKAHQVVAVRGSYTPAGGGSAKHWILATLFTSDGAGNVSALVANDPWTGTQVRIDPSTKQVIFPAGFPLANFTVDGYRVITLSGGAI